MSELREILENIVKDEVYPRDKILQQVRQKRIIQAEAEIKQWAKGCVPEEQRGGYGCLPDAEVKGHNQCRAETLKKIEEE